jgi:phospholipid/cholesterol/gamma-HCH transport system substrate-binding protein
MRRPVLLVVTLLAAALALSGCQFSGAYDLPLPGKQVGSGDGYRVTADFADVVNVVPRTVVMANDVPVGQVDSVKRVGWHARVTMTIRKDIVLPRNATADVRQTSLLGEKYIQLAAPRGASVAKQGRLGDGDVIPLSATARNPEVEEVLGALSFLLSGGGVGQLKTISVELNKMMDGRQSDIRDLLGRMDTLVGSLDDQRENIVAAMDSVNRLTSTLNRERTAVGQALDSFGPALKVLDDQEQSLVRMLRALDRLGDVGTRVITRSRANMVATLRHLAPALRQLADAGDSLPRGLMMMASFPFPKQAETLAKGDYSNALFHMDFDLNKALKGLLKGGDTGLPNISQLCAIYAGTGSCAQLMGALCSVLKVNLFCAPMSDPTGPGTTRTPRNGAGTTTKAPALPALPGVGQLLDQLGLGASGPTSAGGSGSSGGGLLGGLLGLLGGGAS